MIFAFSACTPKQENPDEWMDDEVNDWFEKREWLNGWDVQPDGSINKRSLAIQYFKNKKHWDQAFVFLKTVNLRNLPAGRQSLDGENLYINVDEYQTKNKNETCYESHRKYIDIQYIVEGEELIGLTTPDKLEVKEPYSEERDFAFYTGNEGEYLKATPKNFVVFFPEDAHRPTIKVNDNIQVKKIVVKLRIE